MSLRTTTTLDFLASRRRTHSGWGALALGLVCLSLAGCSTVGDDRSGGKIGDVAEDPGANGGSSTAASSTGLLTSAPDPNASNSAPQSSGEQPGNSGVSSGQQSSTRPETTDTPDENAHLQYLVVTPGDQILELDLKTTRDLSYRAVGFFSDGKSKDMSKEVQWSISTPAMGAFNQDKLTLAPHNELYVQTAVVTAKSDAISARAQLTVAAYQQNGPQKDFVFVLPYEGNSKIRKELKFKTKVQELDVFFSVDTTGSMGEEIVQLSTSLSSTIVPELQKAIPSTQFGVGAVEDFPVGGFGHPVGIRNPRADQPFRLEQEITPTVKAVQEGIGRLSLGRGADYPESILEGLFQIATGKGLSGPGPTMVAPRSGGVGGVGFRKGSMPVVVSITDAASHAPGETADGCNRDYDAQVTAVAATRTQTEEALKKICARVITVASEGNLDVNENCSPRVDGKKLADATEARVSPLVWNGKRPSGCAEGQCCTGLNGVGVAPGSDGLCDLVFDVDSKGTGLDKSIVSGVQALAFFAPFDVITEKEGETKSVGGRPMPGGHTTTIFLKNVQAQSHGPLPIPGLPKPTPSGASFKNVTPGTEVTFSVDAYNNVVPPTTKVQVYRAKVGVKADQCEGLALDKRDVVFVIPPKPLVEG